MRFRSEGYRLSVGARRTLTLPDGIGRPGTAMGRRARGGRGRQRGPCIGPRQCATIPACARSSTASR
jgi:hypothetical protein